MRKYLLLPLLGLLAAASACRCPGDACTVPVQLESVPTGAGFTFDFGLCGTTPAVVAVPKGRDVSVLLTHQGFANQEVVFRAEPRRANGALLLFGGFLGPLMEAASRAPCLEDGHLTVVMDASCPAPGEEPPSEGDSTTTPHDG